jgi:hypothetical protein
MSSAAGVRNKRRVRRLATVSAIEHIGALEANEKRGCVPELRNLAMGLFTREIKNLNDLFVHRLQDIYYAERQLEKAQEMSGKAIDKQLRQGFLTHLDETKTHIWAVMRG